MRRGQQPHLATYRGVHLPRHPRASSLSLPHAGRGGRGWGLDPQRARGHSERAEYSTSPLLPVLRDRGKPHWGKEKRRFQSRWKLIFQAGLISGSVWRLHAVKGQEREMAWAWLKEGKDRRKIKTLSLLHLTDLSQFNRSITAQIG